MKRTFATLTMLIAGILTVALPNGALAELTFGEWATAENYTPPGPASWSCYAWATGITSAEGVSSYTNLRTLRLQENEISSLDAGTFQGLTNLDTLELQYNQISSLDADTFQGLTNLESLELQHNQISSLSANQLQGLTKLISLRLEVNRISSLSADQFQGLTDLRSLRLNSNEISSLSSDQFQGLTDLETLLLYSNEISSLAPNQFQGLENLQTLDLAWNRISSLSVDQFQGLTGLQRLNLRGNETTSLSANQFQGLRNLQRLWLNYNQISSLSANQFHGLEDLLELSLGGNQIASLDLTGFEATALTAFSIYDNPITEVILADATLSQTTLDTLLTGETWAVGIAELAGIGSVDLTAADMAGVDQFDEMFAMADLQTLILTDVLFSEAIVADGYAEIWDLISALDANRLDALTVDQELYAAMQANLDTWDAGPGNVLTVVPEPSTLALLAIGSLALFLWRRKATSR